ncbi:unnamed protein product, partial [Laminaria digitata]
MASPPVGRPAKAPRVTEQGEITSEKPAAAGSTCSGARGNLAAPEAKKASAPARDSKAARKTSASPSPSPSGASRSSTATTPARPQASSSSSSSSSLSATKGGSRTASSSAVAGLPATAPSKTTLVGASRQSAARVSARENAAGVSSGGGGESSKQQQQKQQPKQQQQQQVRGASSAASAASAAVSGSGSSSSRRSSRTGSGGDGTAAVKGEGAEKEMERPAAAARDDKNSTADSTRGTGTLAVRRGSRDVHAPLPR